MGLGRAWGSTGSAVRCREQVIQANTSSRCEAFRGVARATKLELCWLCALVLSFAYERRLVPLTPYDRANPRLFDVVFVIGVLIALLGRRRPLGLPRALRTWRALVLWFCACAILWAVFFLPWEYGKFSLFFAWQYLVGLLAACMVLRIPITAPQKQTLMMLAVAGGIFVSLYCIPEYLSENTLVRLTGDKSVVVAPGTLLGPLGSTYFHLVQYQALAFCIACMVASAARTHRARIGWAAAALFISWPLFFSGARSGPGLLAVSIGALAVMEKGARKTLAVMAVLLIVLFLLMGTDPIRDALTSGRTAQRLRDFSQGSGSIQSRMLLFERFDITAYRWSGASVPFIGAGFGVAPTYSGGFPTYRVDYGTHNIYLFALEQAGLPGLLLFLAFLARVLKGLTRARNSPAAPDQCLAGALTAFLVAILIVGFAGQVFWRGFGTVNFNTYLIVLLMIALKPAVEAAGSRRVAHPATQLGAVGRHAVQDVSRPVVVRH